MDTLSTRIDQRFEAYTLPRQPGCSVCVIKDGEVSHEGSYGLADVEAGVSFTPRTQSNICSLTKQFTAACVTLLEEEGLFAQSTPVHDLVPELPDYGETVTIEHLLHHTSGIRDTFQLCRLQGLDPIRCSLSQAEALALLSRIRGLNFHPGDEHLYCNDGYMLLALIVERVSGKTLPEFAQERIFTPLSMGRTTFLTNPPGDEPGIAVGHEVEDGVATAFARPENGPSGAGGIWSTGSDLGKWMTHVLENTLDWPPDVLRRMLQDGGLNNGRDILYARGQRVRDYRGLDIRGHDGRGYGFTTALLMVPAYRFGIACLTNRVGSEHPWVACLDVARYYHQKVMDFSPRETPSVKQHDEPTLEETHPEPTALNGTFVSEELETTYQIHTSGDEIIIHVASPFGERQFTTKLEWVGGKAWGQIGCFRIDLDGVDVEVALTHPKSSRSDLLVSTPRSRHLRFERV